MSGVVKSNLQQKPNNEKTADKKCYKLLEKNIVLVLLTVPLRLKSMPESKNLDLLRVDRSIFLNLQKNHQQS